MFSAVLATSDLDIDSLDPARKAAAAAAFARMCHTLERPMQLLIRVRRLADPGSAPVAGPHARLDDAMQRYWADQIRDGERHTRNVFVVLAAHTPTALDSTCTQACDRLTALGVSAHRLNGDALADVMTDGFDGSTAITWSEYREHAVYGDNDCLRPCAATTPRASRRPRMAGAAAQRAGRGRHRHPPRAGAAR